MAYTLEELQTAKANAEKSGALDDAKQIDAMIAAMAPKRSLPEEALRQLGLTARAGMTGLAENAQLVTEPLRNVTDMFVPDRTQTLSGLITGAPVQPKSTPLGVQATKLADWLGLPNAETPTERVVMDTNKLLSGTGGMYKAAQKAATMVPGALSAAFEGLASAPAQQVTGALGAGLAGGYAKETGAGPGGQFGAALAGGLAGGALPSVATGLGNVAGAAWRGVKNEFGMGPNPQTMDMMISQALKNSDFDYAALPEKAKQAIRSDMEAVLATGQEVNPEALRRLAEFRAVGATPTQGTITLNPAQITHEQNLAKIGMNTTDPDLHKLGMVRNSNNAAFVKNINELSEPPANAFDAGLRHIRTISAKDKAWQDKVDDLYTQARGTQGRSVVLDGPTAMNTVNTRLKQDLTGKLPPEVDAIMNDITMGKTPLTVDYQQQLIKHLGRKMRNATDGDVRHGLGILRDELDNAPIIEGASQQAGKEALDAFKTARSEARKRFQWRESSEPIKAVIGGVEPDKFVRKFVINGDVADVKSLMDEGHPAQLKGAVITYLKHRALNNADDEIGTFSQSAFKSALEGLGQRKLEQIFSKEELDRLWRLSSVSSYGQVQPSGSAVGNSNTTAVALGKLYDIFKNAMTAKILGPVGPLAASAVDKAIAKPIQNMNASVEQGNALKAARSLVVPQAPVSRIVPMLPPAVAAAETFRND